MIALTHDLSHVQPKTLTCLNIGTGIGTDVNQLEGMIRRHVADVMKGSGKAASLPEPTHGPARPGDLRSNLVDASLAASLLGWKPNVTLEEGIRQTAEWFAGRGSR